MDIMEMLKALFGDEPLTFDQFAEKISTSKDLKLGNLAGGQYVDKNKFDDINNQLTTANKQLQESTDKYKDYDPEWKTKLKQAQDDGDKKLNDYKFAQSVEKAVNAAGAADVISVNANIDMSKVSLDKDGKISGLDEQLTQLKTDKPFLFKSEEPAQQEKKLNLGGPTAGVKSDQMKKDIADMSYEEYKEYRKNN